MASKQVSGSPNPIPPRDGLPLPCEIRLMILRLILQPTEAINIRPTKAGRCKKRNQYFDINTSRLSSMTVTHRLAQNDGYRNLQLTCKQFREDLERPDFLYAGKTFQFRAPHRIRRYLEAIGEGRADQIQSLELDFSIFWFNTKTGACDKVFQMLHNCKKLKHLSFSVHGRQTLPQFISSCTQPVSPLADRRYLSWDEFRTDSLKGLKDLRGLETFKMPIDKMMLQDIWPANFKGANKKIAIAQLSTLSRSIEQVVTAAQEEAKFM